MIGRVEWLQATASWQGCPLWRCASPVTATPHIFHTEHETSGGASTRGADASQTAAVVFCFGVTETSGASGAPGVFGFSGVFDVLGVFNLPDVPLRLSVLDMVGLLAVLAGVFDRFGLPGIAGVWSTAV